MSKQDRTRARTPTDIEQKYNFGQTFADVFGLITDAQKAAEAAQKAVDSLDHEQIFNLLTDNGKIQGVYRGDDGDVYINATYIKSGKLAAEFIDADNLNVKAANITGTLTFNQLSTELQQQITANDPEAYLQSIGITTIDSGSVKSPRIEGGQIFGAEMYGGVFAELDGESYIKLESSTDSDGTQRAYMNYFANAYSSISPIASLGYVFVPGVGFAWALMVAGKPVIYVDLVTKRITYAQSL